MKVSKNSHIKYASFSNSSKVERLRALQLNKLINVRVKCESLNNINVLEEAEYNNKKQTVAEVIMSAKVNGMPLFIGVEQGSGKNNVNTYVYFKPNMSTEAKEWISKKFGTTFKVKDKADYEISAPKQTITDKECHSELNDYIIDRLKIIKI